MQDTLLNFGRVKGPDLPDKAYAGVLESVRRRFEEAEALQKPGGPEIMPRHVTQRGKMCSINFQIWQFYGQAFVPLYWGLIGIYFSWFLVQELVNVLITVNHGDSDVF
eukprot:symbB.v1.2.018346.t1/scaffold1457.1/size117646/4